MSGIVDAVLGPQRFTRDDQYRARLIVITSLAVAAGACVLVVLVFALRWGPKFIPSAAGGGALLVVNLWMLRRTGRLELAAMVLCLGLLAAVSAACWLAGGLSQPVLPWTLLVPFYAPMLLRPRLAIVCVGLVIASIGSLYVAEASGYQFPPIPGHLGALVSDQMVLTLLVAALVWMYERARRDALAERDTALAALEASGETRIALVENVQAVIFSVDPELRLIAGNSLFDVLSHHRGQPPIRSGELVLDCLAESQRADIRALFARAFAGEHFSVERTLELRSTKVESEILFNPIRRASGEVRGVTVFGRDISDRNRARAELDRLNRELREAAHLAGKAEVATDVLHNVGNVLTSLNISADLVLERLRGSKIGFVGKTVALFPTTATDLARFFSSDDKGKQVPAYLALLADTLDRERIDTIAEMESVHRQLDHVKSVIARQQAFARANGAVECVSIEEVIANAISLQASGFKSHGIAVTTELSALPHLVLDRNKLVEILNNFLVNSRQALDAATVVDKRVVVRAFRNERGGLQIDVADNGVGIDPALQVRLFSYGFTTKTDGHGFGLAGSLLSARAMGGTASGHSDGPGTGATFTVELPFTTSSATSTTERAA